MKRKQISEWWKVALLVTSKLKQPLVDSESLIRDTNQVHDSAETLQRVMQSFKTASSRKTGWVQKGW